MRDELARLHFVDIHSHVLPMVDDGAGDLPDALAMLAVAANDGVTTMVATPHAARIDRAGIQTRVAALRAAAQADGLTITILPGSEVRFDADIASRFRAGELQTIADTAYLLVELPLQGEWSPYLQQGLYEAASFGALPILAHAERYPAVQRNPDLLLDLIAQGVLIQVNADGLTGGARRTAARTAEILLRRRMAHVIASDAHGVTRRAPRLSAAFARASALAGPDYSGWVWDVPARIIRGEAVILPDPLPEARRGWRSLLPGGRERG